MGILIRKKEANEAPQTKSFSRKSLVKVTSRAPHRK